MRTKKFNDQITAALLALGFNIDADGEVARAEKDVTLGLVQSARNDELFLEIVLPDGRLSWNIPVSELLEAAGMDEDEEQEA
jgi:hypothetical protein